MAESRVTRRTVLRSILFLLGLGSSALPLTLLGSSPQAQGAAAQRQQSGVSTGGAYRTVLDANKRPITAGGFVDKGPIVFQDVAKQAGLTSWRHVMGTPQKKFIIETVGSGVALVDYDNDGWLDIYLVNGSTYDALAGKAKLPRAALFHNNRMARSRTWRRKPALRTTAGESAWPSVITTTTAGRICT